MLRRSEAEPRQYIGRKIDYKGRWGRIINPDRSSNADPTTIAASARRATSRFTRLTKAARAPTITTMRCPTPLVKERASTTR
jgi:hypothetical protein